MKKLDQQGCIRRCQRGLWVTIRAAERAGWLVRVYHDGTAESILERFRSRFDPALLEIVRVVLPPDMRKRKHLSKLLSMFAADDPSVDVFVTRNLEEKLSAQGLRLLTSEWVETPDSGIQVAREGYRTDRYSHLNDPGWFGQRNTFGDAHRPRFIPMVFAHFRANKANDWSHVDASFLTHFWIPVLQHTGHAGRIARIPSHSQRAAHSDSPTFGAFLRQPLGGPPRIKDTILDVSTL